MKMDKSVQITSVIVIGVLVLAFMGFYYMQDKETNTVTGQGQARLKVMPDKVAVYFNLESEGKTSEEANSLNSEKMDKLLTNLLKEGFERKDVQTMNFNIYPEYELINNKNVFKGYKAVHSVKVEMSSEQTSKIGKVIDTGVEAGAGISYINFELSPEKQNEYKKQALELAAKDAKTKAEAVASGLGKEVGALVSTSSNEFDYYPWGIYQARDSAASAEEAKIAATNIQPGEQEVSASVTAVFKLK